MKKVIGIYLAIVILFNSGCGAILGGRIDHCQTVKGDSGTPSRSIRPAALIGDIFIGAFIINLIVDFATGAIYKPCTAYSNPNTQQYQTQVNRQHDNYPPPQQQYTAPQPQQTQIPVINQTATPAIPIIYNPKVGDTVTMDEFTPTGQDLHTIGVGIITGIKDPTHWIVTFVLNGQNTTGYYEATELKKYIPPIGK